MPRLLLKQLPRFECLLQAALRFPDLHPSSTSAFLHLLRTGDLVFDSEAECLAQAGLSQGRFSILMLLFRHPETPQTPASLAEEAGVTRATMTGLLDNLEKDALVARTPCPSDRRLTLVHLTPKASELLERIVPVYFRHVASLLACLSDAEKNQLIGLLQKIQESLGTPSPSEPEAPPTSCAP
ncbi:MAG: Transcriptional repressor MprA [Verrucomicrobiota bacterium]|jgi:DNA-binding MarR family transcriptional regulator